jgi:hypothetical protein
MDCWINELPCPSEAWTLFDKNPSIHLSINPSLQVVPWSMMPVDIHPFFVQRNELNNLALDRQ